MILKCDCSLGDSYVTKTLTMPTDFWVQFDILVPQSTIDAISSGFTALFVAFPDPPAGWGDDGIFLSSIDSLSDIETTGSPSSVANAFSVDVFHTIKFHVNGTSVTWSLDGSTLFTYTGGWSPGDLSGSQTFDFGGIFSSTAPGEVYFLDNVKVGTSSGASDIFSDDFESGTLGAWDTTVGDATVVAGTGGGPGPLQITLSPGRDRATATVTISGSGFTASDPITATFNGGSLTISAGSTDGDGNFSGTFTVPTVSPGTYTVTVTDSHSVSASALFRVALGSDTLTVASSALIGSNLSVNGIAPVPPIGDGDMILHLGVPHVAWVENHDNGDGTFGWFGPYAAAWNGSDWTLLTAAGAFPDATDYGDISLQTVLDGDTVSNVCYQRRLPRLASDGETLYLSVIGINMQRVRTNPGHDPPLYHYAQRSLQYGFELDGSAWAAISDPIWGVFPLTVAPDGPYTTGTEPTPYDFISADISATSGNPGKVYFAFSDHGDISFPSLTEFSHVSIVGTDLVETSLATDDEYPLSLAGSGSTLTLYYGAATTFPRPTLNVWTPGGTSTITATTDLDFDFTGYTDIVLGPPVTLEQDGHRYAAFGLSATHSSTSVWLNLVVKGSPSTPTVLTSIDSRLSGTGVPLELATFAVDSFVPLTLHNDGSDWWLSTNSSSSFGPNYVFQLDLICPRAPTWITNNLLPIAAEAQGRTVDYDDKIWWFTAADDGLSLDGPMVYATPICRGCGPVCAAGDLHIWKRV